ncbi:hypothetical protein F5050DRAFT_1761930 [Lentinula boryana]|uniref:Carboxylesterase type B domain-containing protein n=1 Tax=Lentinula boryana TaxID=40481 RepID=A0ABQ8QC61_9AGAR|nr:hypothetical protein F5050DRAFT_1761930 [Lentinula boryana]
MTGGPIGTLGIPYAEPPIGNLRLRPPVLKTTLDTESFDASNFGFACLQSVSMCRQSNVHTALKLFLVTIITLRGLYRFPAVKSMIL